MYPDAGGYMLIIKEEYKEDLLFYYGILNSSLFYHFIKLTSTAFNNNYYYFKTAYIKQFKFPKDIDEKIKNHIKENVLEILSLRSTDVNNDVSKYEKEIDQMVYKLYGLSKEETVNIEEKYNIK